MQNDIRIDVAQLLRFLVRGLLPAAAIGALAAFAIYQWSSTRQPEYEATAAVLATQANPGLREFGLSVINAAPLEPQAYQVAATSDAVLAGALMQLGNQDPQLDEIRRLGSNIEAKLDNTRSSLVYIIGEGSTASVAADRANALAQSLIEWDRNRAAQSVDQLVEALEIQIETLTEQIGLMQSGANAGGQDQVLGLINQRAQRQEQLAYARALSASASPTLALMQPASLPAAPVSPRPVRDAAIGFFLAFVLTYAVLLLVRALDSRIRSPEDLAHVTGLPVIAEYPRFRRGDKAGLREASSYLRTNLLFSSADVHPKVFLVTSSQANEGKTLTSTSLAEGFVRNGYRTLLIDADLRAPSVAKLYRISSARNHSSLVDWLQDPHGQHETAQVAIGPGETLDVIPVFQPVQQAAELLSGGFRDSLDRWRKQYDVILVDSSPVLAVADTLTVAPYSTATVVVADVQKTRRGQVKATVDLLRRIGVNVIGVTANYVKREAGGQGAGYGYGYGIAAADEPATNNVKPRAAGTVSSSRRISKA